MGWFKTPRENCDTIVRNTRTLVQDIEADYTDFPLLRKEKLRLVLRSIVSKWENFDGHEELQERLLELRDYVSSKVSGS